MHQINAKSDFHVVNDLDLLDAYNDRITHTRLLESHVADLDLHVRALHSSLVHLCDVNLTKCHRDMAAAKIQAWYRRYRPPRTIESVFRLVLHLDAQVRQLQNVLSQHSPFYRLLRHHAARLIQAKWRSSRHPKPATPTSPMDTQIMLSEADTSFLNQVSRSTSIRHNQDNAPLPDANCTTQYVSMDDFNYLKAEVEALRLELELRNSPSTPLGNNFRSSISNSGYVTTSDSVPVPLSVDLLGLWTNDSHSDHSSPIQETIHTPGSLLTLSLDS